MNHRPFPTDKQSPDQPLAEQAANAEAAADELAADQLEQIRGGSTYQRYELKNVMVSSWS